jgi:hypothetical protein
VAPLKLVVVTANAAVVATVIDRFAVATCAVGVDWSMTPTVKPDGPDPEGSPVIAPVELFSDNPAGSAPDVMVHEYCLTPPETATFDE